MFKTIAELVDIAKKENLKISQVMILREESITKKSKEVIIKAMEKNLEIMEKAIERGLKEDTSSFSGFTGNDAKKLSLYIEKETTLSGRDTLEAVMKSMATSEVNAAMGTIVATPTAGSCGILPGVIFSAAKKLGSKRNVMVEALFTAGAIGYVIANNACISGATGGCQAEVGSATAMAAAAVVEMAGGSPAMSAEAVAIALKNMLGLVCDPVAGLVEIPCIKRNALGAALALVSADLSLAGIKSVIPADEVIEAMYTISKSMPTTLKETALGGLAVTKKGKMIKDKVFGRS